jgi:hypothetical protein
MSDYLTTRSSSSIPIPLSLTSDSANDNLPDLVFDDDPQFIEYDKLTNYSSNQNGNNGNGNGNGPNGIAGVENGGNTSNDVVVGSANGLFLTDTNYQQRNHYRKVAHLSSTAGIGKQPEEWKDNRQGLTIQHVLR